MIVKKFYVSFKLWKIFLQYGHFESIATNPLKTLFKQVFIFFVF